LRPKRSSSAQKILCMFWNKASHDRRYKNPFLAATRERQMKTLKVRYKFETQLDCLVGCQKWYSWYEEWQTGRSGDYIQKWNHCVPFAFNKLRDKNI